MNLIVLVILLNMSTITKELQTIREKVLGLCVSSCIYDHNPAFPCVSCYKKSDEIMGNFRRLLEEQAREIIGEDEPATIDQSDGHTSTNWDGITRNFHRQEMRIHAGVTDTQGKEDEEE